MKGLDENRLVGGALESDDRRERSIEDVLGARARGYSIGGSGG